MALQARSIDAWEDQFRTWAKPPSQSEIERCERAESAIKNAIERSEVLSRRNVRVFAHGSYRNRTNIPRESDVDIGVVCADIFFADYPTGTDRAAFGNVASDYTYASLKNDVGKALTDYFGSAAVRRGNKAFDLKATSYHIEADVAAFFEYRQYSRDGSHRSGLKLIPDNGQPSEIINYPEQHYQNGVLKNDQTLRRYKALVRVLKNLVRDMEDNQLDVARPISGFLCECLTWNVPNSLMGSEQYTDDVRRLLQHVWQSTCDDSGCGSWCEVNDIKYLFRPSQRWTRQQVNDFMAAAWGYIGFN